MVGAMDSAGACGAAPARAEHLAHLWLPTLKAPPRRRGRPSQARACRSNHWCIWLAAKRGVRRACRIEVGHTIAGTCRKWVKEGVAKEHRPRVTPPPTRARGTAVRPTSSIKVPPPSPQAGGGMVRQRGVRDNNARGRPGREGAASPRPPPTHPTLSGLMGCIRSTSTA
jgi:hypothetical protein